MKKLIVNIVVGRPKENTTNGVLCAVNNINKLIASQSIFDVHCINLKSDTGKLYSENDYYYRAYLPILSKRLKEDLVSHCDSDVVYIIHGFYQPIYVAIARYLNLNGCRYYLFLHGSLNSVARGKSFFTKTCFNYFAKKFMIKNGAGVICLNENEMLDAVRFGVGEDKIKIINNFYIMDEVNTKIDKTPKVEGVFTVTCIARLDIYTKGLDTLLEVINVIGNKKSDRKCNIKFVIRGPSVNNGYEYIKKYLDKRGLSGLVDLGPTVHSDSKLELYEKTDATILLSRNEGMPMSVIESLRYGIPAFVTKATNMPSSSAEEKAVVIVSREPDKIASEIFAIASNVTLQQVMREGAYEYFARNYSQNSVIPKYDELFNE